MSTEHWKKYSNLWKHIKPPLRPTAEDLGFADESVSELKNPTHGLLLGVTQELSLRKWSDSLQIVATDNVVSMIHRVKTVGNPVAVCCDWFRLPFPAEQFDIAFGDGSLNSIKFSDYPQLVNELSRVLKRDGLVSIRVYVRPDTAEKIESIRAVVSQIGNFHILKWRIAMALQPEVVATSDGIVLHDIWKTISLSFPDFEELAKLTGWPLEEISTINSYKDNVTVYSFPRLEDVKDAFSTKFDFVATKVATYELADRCPTLVFRNKGQC